MRLSSRRMLSGLLAAGLCAGAPRAVGVAIASQDDPLIDVRSSAVSLTVSHPHWAPDSGAFQFDVTYTGLHAAATGVYSLYNCTDHRIGEPVFFPVKWAKKTTITLAPAGECVAAVWVGMDTAGRCSANPACKGCYQP